MHVDTCTQASEAESGRTKANEPQGSGAASRSTDGPDAWGLPHETWRAALQEYGTLAAASEVRALLVLLKAELVCCVLAVGGCRVHVRCVQARLP